MSLEDLVYAASVLDCEGSISAYVRKDRGSGGYFRLDVSVSNTNKVLTDWLVSVFGGSVQGPKQYDERCKPIYHWSVGDRAAENFLLLIKPYVKLKQNQIEIALALRSTIGGNDVKSEVIIHVRQTLIEALRKLNKRGVSNES